MGAGEEACGGSEVGVGAAERARVGDASCSEAMLAACDASALGLGELGRPGKGHQKCVERVVAVSMIYLSGVA